VVLPRASESVSVGVGGNGGGRGGRNQHLVLTVGWGLLCGIDNGEEVDSWKSAELVRFVHEVMRGELDFVVVSGGTDGEDGNTQCAGGWIDHQWLVSSARDPQIVVDTLARFDSHSLLGRTGNLLETGPTHTNVCDLRVVLVRRHQP
jgi:hydroxypyruvate reductase